MPITSSGFKIKTESEFFDEIVDEFKNEFPTMSEDEGNGLIILARILASQEADIENYRAEAYNNKYVLNAVGSHLDKAVFIAGISRDLGSKATGTATLSFSDGATSFILPSYFELSVNGYTFITTNTEYINVDTDNYEIEIIADKIGSEYNLTQGTSLTIKNPVAGLGTAELTYNTVGGKDLETDEELRFRYYSVMTTYDNSSLEGIISYVEENTEVVKVSGIENTTINTVDSMPPKSFQIFVNGGTDESVASAILQSKPAGIESYGTSSYDVALDGTTYTVYFSRLTPVSIYYDLIIKIDASLVPTDYEDTIKQSLITYTNANETLNVSDLTGNIFLSVDGILSVRQLYYGTTANPTTSDEISVSLGEIFYTVESDINITFIT